ncbi:MAG: hypothetical protein IIA70_08190, partial [Proteobacteria bacterium]|nr:hypothetical protein [Pseudomonadota bacterium]
MELSEATVSAGPAVGGDRIISLDVLRGFAILGILLMNILAMGMPWWVFSNPEALGEILPAELLTYRITDMFVEGTLRTVFSMLFGAGIVLFTARLAARHVPVAGLYYRRTLLLILFGLINGYIFIWWGDILFSYGLAGLLLYFARNLKPRTLIIIAALMFALLGAARFGNSFTVKAGLAELPAIEAVLEAGEELNEKQQNIYDQFLLFKGFHSPSDETIDEAIAAFDGSIMDVARWNAGIYSMFTTNPQFVIFIQLDVIMMMLFGMALYKWGVLSGQRSKAFYWRVLGLGSRLMCEKYGHPELSMTVKGQEFAGYDSRALQGMGLGFATSNRGACHLKHDTFAQDMEDQTGQGKAKPCKDSQDLIAMVDSTGLCLFTMAAWGVEEFQKQIDAACAGDWPVERLIETGERIWNLERLFNLRAGLTAADD